MLTFYFLLRGLRDGAYWRTLPQRLGFLPRSFRQTSPGAIWLHAVSVGEIQACVELLRGLRQALPRTPAFVSTTTLAGRAMAEEKLTGLAQGVFYAPVDYAFAVRRVLRALRPSVVAIAETEIWPNLIHETRRTGAAVTILNARISDRALPRYLRFRWFFGAALEGVDSILAQSEAMRQRFVAAGAPAGRVRVGGNLKYDFAPRAADAGSPVARWMESLRPAKVWIAASTMPPAEPGDPDEDDAVIEAFERVKQDRPDLVLVLAPRKPERFEAVARKLDAAGIGFLRRSAMQWGGPPGLPSSPELAAEPRPRVLLLDTIGELSGLFALADVVFMGGTLARRGGHNILEPAFFGKPVIAGPHMENFQAIADEFRQASACLTIDGAEDLPAALERLLRDPGEMGGRGRACAQAERGAASRAVAEIAALHARGVPRYRPAQPWPALGAALALAWEWGGRRKRTRGLKHARKLAVPVISVGNLTMGGTGKTPCVLHLAETLKEHGRNPGILTRGYGRGESKAAALAAGAQADAALAGDEPRIFLSSGLAPVGIGADRFETGELLLRDFPVDALILDDGFQHARLHRDLDLLLIDALEPFGRGGLFPLGRLREPLSAIARADAVIITRAEFSDLAGAVESEVRRWNPRAPILRAAVQPVAWVAYGSGARYSPQSPPFQRAAAMCALGNPRSFLRTLEQLGVAPLDWAEFPDHHRYAREELRRLSQRFAARGAQAIVTTEKDAMNLPDKAAFALPIYWLQVAMSIEPEEQLLSLLKPHAWGWPV
ncbi:MAG TPA: tetraacyldisaccharide 4'-kinase [Bryobacteraceae bacterium]|nr:tetraacyldisaccharide 4'-kinase [Bryobacteraceae bacterium]